VLAIRPLEFTVTVSLPDLLSWKTWQCGEKRLLRIRFSAYYGTSWQIQTYCRPLYHTPPELPDLANIFGSTFRHPPHSEAAVAHHTDGHHFTKEHPRCEGNSRGSNSQHPVPQPSGHVEKAAGNPQEGTEPMASTFLFGDRALVWA